MRELLNETASYRKSNRVVGIVKPVLEPRYHGTGYFPKRFRSGQSWLWLLIVQESLENCQALFV